MALGVDDVEAAIEGDEVPILDGSAAPWCRLILEAGIVETAMPRRRLALRRPVELARDGRLIRAEPADFTHYAVGLDLAHWGTLHWQGVPDGAEFLAELAPARSFGRLKWALPAAILARLLQRESLRGASFSNTAPLVGGRILGGARLPAEPVRHRALDLLGDLALLGAPLQAQVTAWRPSHAMNHAFLHHLLRDADALEWVEG
jgi:UDP-3-O-[3-hydroxymyristoyl] N-acetylglucosamine deacetylase